MSDNPESTAEKQILIAPTKNDQIETSSQTSKSRGQTSRGRVKNESETTSKRVQSLVTSVGNDKQVPIGRIVKAESRTRPTTVNPTGTKPKPIVSKTASVKSKESNAKVLGCTESLVVKPVRTTCLSVKPKKPETKSKQQSKDTLHIEQKAKEPTAVALNSAPSRVSFRVGQPRTAPGAPVKIIKDYTSVRPTVSKTFVPRSTGTRIKQATLEKTKKDSSSALVQLDKTRDSSAVNELACDLHKKTEDIDFQSETSTETSQKDLRNGESHMIQASPETLQGDVCSAERKRKTRKLKEPEVSLVLTLSPKIHSNTYNSETTGSKTSPVNASEKDSANSTGNHPESSVTIAKGEGEPYQEALDMMGILELLQTSLEDYYVWKETEESDTDETENVQGIEKIDNDYEDVCNVRDLCMLVQLQELLKCFEDEQEQSESGNKIFTPSFEERTLSDDTLSRYDDLHLCDALMTIRVITFLQKIINDSEKPRPVGRKLNAEDITVEMVSRMKPKTMNELSILVDMNVHAVFNRIQEELLPILSQDDGKLLTDVYTNYLEKQKIIKDVTTQLRHRKAEEESNSDTDEDPEEIPDEEEDQKSENQIVENDVKVLNITAGDIIAGLAMGTTVERVVGNVQIGCQITENPPQGDSGWSEGPVRRDWIKLIDLIKYDFSWLHPFPWDPSVKIQPEEYYIELTLNTYDREGKGPTKRKAELRELFDPVVEGGSRVKTVLLRGDAGFGKSTLCIKTFFDWAHEKATIDAFPWKQTIPVLYKLRYLRKEGDLEEQLFNYVHSYYSPEVPSIETTRKTLRILGTNLLIILDGYDEIDADNQRKVRNLLSSFRNDGESPFLRASFLVTSRPTEDDTFLSMFEKHFVIDRITEEQIELILRKFHKNDRRRLEQFRKHVDSIKPFRSYLPQKEKPMSLNDLSPLIIFILAWIKRETRTLEKRNNSAKTKVVAGLQLENDHIVYNCIFLLAKRCNEKEGYGLTDDYIKMLLRRLGQMCLGLCDGPILFESDLRGVFKEDYCFITSIGVFKIIDKVDGIFFEATHKMFLDSLVQVFWTGVECSWQEIPEQRKIADFLKKEFDLCSGFLTQVLVYHPKNGDLSIEIRITCSMKRGTMIFRLEWNNESTTFNFYSPWALPKVEPKNSVLRITIADVVVGPKDQLFFSRAIPSEKYAQKYENFWHSLIDMETEMPNLAKIIILDFEDDTCVKNILFSEGTSFYMTNLHDLVRSYSVTIEIFGTGDRSALFYTALEATCGISAEDVTRCPCATNYMKDLMPFIQDKFKYEPELSFQAGWKDYKQKGWNQDIPAYYWQEISKIWLQVLVWPQSFPPFIKKTSP